jgi:SAM-dependent methyltransferase
MRHQHGEHHHHDHDHSGHGHAHGHAHDQGWLGFARYLRLLPMMWSSEVSTAVVGQMAPRPGERVVEIGSGMGAAMIVAARTGSSLVAVDPTPYMRRILKLRRLALPGRQRIEVVDGAAESLPVADGSVDAVWTVNTMHHWSDADRALREIHRVLRPGGRLLLVDEDFDDPDHPHHREFQQRRARHSHGFTMIDPTALAAQLRSLGFSTATGAQEQIAGRPAKTVRGVKG